MTAGSPAFRLVTRVLRSIPRGTPGKSRLARRLLRRYRGLRDVTVRGRDGVPLLLPHLDEPVAFHLLIDGVYEPECLAFLGRTLGPGGVLVDVGANIGALSVPGARLVAPGGAVLAIEASSRLFRYLQHNTGACPGVRCVNRAAADVAGPLPFYEAPPEKFGMGSLGPQFDRPPTMVTAARLDDLLAEACLDRVDVLKMDVEGAEGLVVAGATQLLSGPRPPLVLLEFCDWAEARFPAGVGDAQRRLRALGYQTWRLEEFGRDRLPLEVPLTTGYAMLVAARQPFAVGRRG
jgi:FkbM family methyltransferase